MTIDPRTPVIIGAAQVSHRPPVGMTGSEAPDPIDLMAEAVRNAAEDSGSADTLSAIGTIAVVGGLWRYRNPGALIAEELALGRLDSILTTFGGNQPIHATHHLATRIANGEIDIAVVVGGECNLTRRALAKQDEELRRREEPDGDDVEHWGPDLDMGASVAADRGGEIPRNSYAIIDSAIRAHRGETLDAARDRAAELWAGYAAVAAGNPHAADRSAPDADWIRTPSPENRMVSWPYTKAMCANNTVDHAGAIVLCAEAVADRLGVAANRRVYPLQCVTAADTSSVLDREHIHAAPGMRAAARKVADDLGGPEQIGHVDLYSCFPSIVTLTVEALGIDADRPLTVNGGLAFAGAPLNFAAGEGLVAMVTTLRDDPGSIGVVQGNGGHATKHAFGVYATTPPSDPHHIDDLGSFDPGITVAPADRSGPAVLLGVTVEYDRDGPTRAIAIVQFDDDSRGWAVSDDHEIMRRFVTDEMVGRPVVVEAGVMTLVQAE